MVCRSMSAKITQPNQKLFEKMVCVGAYAPTHTIFSSFTVNKSIC
jgi:hypothetical protein